MGKIIISIAVSAIIGYFIGCVNLAYLVSKFKGYDIRKYGSGNAGASNVVILMGKKAGIFVALFDIFKAFCAVYIAEFIFPQAVINEFNYAGVMAGAATIIGHIAPFYMGFKGGKGLASLGGTILALDSRLFVLLLFFAVVLAVVTDYICFVPVTVVVLFPAVFGYLNKSFIPMIIFIVPIILVWWRHVENFRRIKLGKELKFHFLWNRENEASRMGVRDDGEEVFTVEVDSDGIFNKSTK